MGRSAQRPRPAWSAQEQAGVARRRRRHPRGAARRQRGLRGALRVRLPRLRHRQERARGAVAARAAHRQRPGTELGIAAAEQAQSPACGWRSCRHELDHLARSRHRARSARADLRARLQLLELVEGAQHWRPWPRRRPTWTVRIERFLPDGPLEAGTYRLCFDTSTYFEVQRPARRSIRRSTSSFAVTAATEHYHIPLLLSPSATRPTAGAEGPLDVGTRRRRPRAREYAKEIRLTLVEEIRARARGALAARTRPSRPAIRASRRGRQPVHTVYGGAHVRGRDGAALRESALRSMARYARTPASSREASGLRADAALASAVYARVHAKLQREPVEDFRIDFEDGFGARSDAEEDGAAAAAARALGRASAARGSRRRSPASGSSRSAMASPARAGRSSSSSARCSRSAGALFPPRFVVTLPKVNHRGAARGRWCAARAARGAARPRAGCRCVSR